MINETDKYNVDYLLLDFINDQVNEPINCACLSSMQVAQFPMTSMEIGDVRPLIIHTGYPTTINF